VKLFFKKLIWPFLVVLLIELLFAQSQRHWFIVTLVLVFIDVLAVVGFRFIVPRRYHPSSS
jgi:hypothetical protein